MDSPAHRVLPGHGRFQYSPINGRPVYRWPDGSRLAVYIGFNIEHFAFGEGLGPTIGPVMPEPDVLNHAWREYALRVGAWRCLGLFEELAHATANGSSPSSYSLFGIVQAPSGRFTPLEPRRQTRRGREKTYCGSYSIC